MGYSKDLGVCIPCYTGDTDLLAGCIVSLKTFYPELQICLIPHGRPPISGLVKRYDLKVIDPAKVEPLLARFSYGYGLTKMIAFWHSPFDRFWHIDADAVVWGRPLDFPSDPDNLFVANTPHEIVTDTILRQQYYDPAEIPGRYQELRIDRDSLFNSGVFFAERGSLNLQSYLTLLEHQRHRPSSIFVDQGILNLLVAEANQCGGLKFVQRRLQTVVAVTSPAQLEVTYKISVDGPVLLPTTDTVIHWAGPKPRRSEDCPFTGPMDYFRLKNKGFEALWQKTLGKQILGFDELACRGLLKIERRFDRLAASMNFA